MKQKIDKRLQQAAVEAYKSAFDSIRNFTVEIFKSGAEWMASQGETHEATVLENYDGALIEEIYLDKFKKGDKVIVQIRRKHLSDIANSKAKESEDKRVRKNCIHFLELQKAHHAATFEIEECIAWLKKQVQVKESPEIQHENKTCEENADSLTRNNEQKPTDDIDAAKASEEYRKYRVSCGITDPVMLDEIEEAYYEGAIRQKSASWSEKDEKTLDDIINDYEIRASLADEFSIVKNNSLIKVHWLKSLKSRLQQDVLKQ